MRLVSRPAVALAAAAVLTAASHVGAQTLREKLDRDQTITVPTGDPDMAAAMRRARDTLPEFLSLWRAPRASTRLFSVKIAIRDNGVAEYFWIEPFVEKDGHFSGTIDNTPETVRNVKLGDTITFDEQQIVDWTYLDGKQMKGNFTACVLFKQAPRQEAEAVIKRYGMSCEL